ncbi:MAG: XrtN system VIT domain-containing protein [Bacteroidota bacterium]
MKTTSFDFSILKDFTFRLGLALLIISSSFFFLTMSKSTSNFEPLTSVFFFNYLFFCFYFFWLVGNNKKATGKLFKFSDLKKNILLLLLFNVSAYSLNRSIPVFQNSTEWLQVFLVALNLAMIAFCLRPRPLRPDAINFFILIVLSLGFVFQIYQAIYLIPLYGFSVMAFWFFGIPIHSFIAIWFCVTLYKMLKKYQHAADVYRWFILGSMATPLVVVVAFGIKWNQINNTISTVYPKHSQYRNSTSKMEQPDLPNWVKISQQLNDDWITKRALKSEMVYTILDPSQGDIFFPSNRFGNRLNEPLQHDPLVAITSLIFGKIDIAWKDKYQLYQATFNARHQTEERLWSGDHLSTNTIKTDVQLFPEHRIAYTEKTLTIKNNYNKTNTWRNRNTQEAIYSFYLPEGAVVTSASLWVNGVEEKSYLTTKSKADSAYKAIVGVERRDPLLLHWQEGNRISVRVFPCTPDEDRKFKIGVTAPLKYDDKKLIYQNIDFEGPNWKAAKEQIHILPEKGIKNLTSRLWLDQSEEGWKYDGKYKSDWSLKMDAPPLAYSSFSFNGRNLNVKDLLPFNEKFSPQEVYLDINASWTKRKCRRIWKNLKDKTVYVFDKKMVRVTDDNYSTLFKKLRRQRFSLFPFHKIKNVKDALVITRGDQFSPSLSDLKKSTFAVELNNFLGKNETAIRVYHLGSEMTTYLKTLKELQVFNFQKGNWKKLRQQLHNNRFPKDQRDESTVSIPIANMQIETETGEQKLNNAPDHLLRLFAYNDVMKKIGKNYFQQKHITESLIGAAQEAYVVTPISSMVVLETQKDYERFGIEAVKNSLKNASIKNSGSVPEPHEWLLIILCVITMLYLKWSRNSLTG